MSLNSFLVIQPCFDGQAEIQDAFSFETEMFHDSVSDAEQWLTNNDYRHDSELNVWVKN